jgi:hypothetical protein
LKRLDGAELDLRLRGSEGFQSVDFERFASQKHAVETENPVGCPSSASHLPILFPGKANHDGLEARFLYLVIQVNKATGANLDSGFIGIQSEGGAFEIREAVIELL